MLSLERLSDAQRSGHPILALVRGSADQSGRRQQWADGPQWTGPAAGDPPGARKRRTVDGSDRRPLRGTARERRSAIRSRRRRCLPPTGRRSTEEPLVAWVDQVEHRPPAGCRGSRGSDQDGDGACGTRLLPKTLHVDEPSSRWIGPGARSSCCVEERTWERADQPRRAGVSSFGASGTNAHVILEEAPCRRGRFDLLSGQRETTAMRRRQPARRGFRSPPVGGLGQGPISALREQARHLLDHLERIAGVSPADIGISLATSRSGA